METPKSGSAGDSPALNVSKTLAASGGVCGNVQTCSALPSGGSCGWGSPGSWCPLQELPPPCLQGLRSVPAQCCCWQSQDPPLSLWGCLISVGGWWTQLYRDPLL